MCRKPTTATHRAGAVQGADAWSQSAVAISLTFSAAASRGQPQLRDGSSRKCASWAWVFETTSQQEQERRREQIEQNQGDLDFVISRGEEIVVASFWALVKVGLVE